MFKARPIAIAVVIAALGGGGASVAEALQATPQSEQSAGPEAGRFLGTFLQLTQAHYEWDRAQWTRLFGYFRELGLEELIVQWALLDEVAFYRSRQFPAGDGRGSWNPPIETILDLADEAGLRVRIGLAASSDYWQVVSEHPELVKVKMARRYLRSLAVAEELVDMLTAHSSFHGWYITEEIDDQTWAEPERRETLFDYLSLLSMRLKELAPAASVSVSGFSNAFLDLTGLSAFWGGLLDAAAVDTVLFQDGIGAGKLELRELPLYLDAVRRTTQERSRRFQVIVEIFEQTGGTPIDDGPFTAEPAAFDDVLEQLRVASEFAGDGIIAFSIPEYLSPLRGADAAQRYEQYLRYLKP